jgi:molybdenum cofactor cytidylyltransferase
MSESVTAVVLAAGQSRRMGRSKQLLPWEETTVLGQTLQNVRRSTADAILLVTGDRQEEVEQIAGAQNIPTVHNPHYATGEMLSSLQVAVRHLPQTCQAVLVVLADQPMIEPETYNQIMDAYRQGQGDLIAPVYQGRRGNPVLIGRPFFEELLELPVGDAPRTLLRRNEDQIYFVEVDSNTILRDLDRPEDYERHRPA